MNIKNVLFFSINLLTLFFSLPATENAYVIRAAIDLGSGGPKLRVAEVNLTANKIIKILHIEQTLIPFQDSLAQSSDRSLSPEIMLKGLEAFKGAIAKAKSLGAEKIAAIATAAFRNARNGSQFMNEIQAQTGIKVHILDQDLEGELAFQAAFARLDICPKDLITWDIGGGSTQLVGRSSDDRFLIERSQEGSGTFKNFIIERIQQRNIKEFKSPNPMSSEVVSQAEAYARELAEKVNLAIKNKICQPSTQIVGVGSVFGRGIAVLLNHKNPFTVEDLAEAVNGLIDKTDADLGGGDFAFVEVSNAVLTLGFMRGLNIKQMSIVDINNADGVLVYEPFWNTEP